MATLKLSGADVLVLPEDLTEGMRHDFAQFPRSGSCDDAVSNWLRHHRLDVEPTAARAYLLPYGAWELDDLQDYQTNVERLVWLIGMDLNEHGEAHLSQY